MQISHQIPDSVKRFQTALAGLFHRRNGGGVGHQRLEGQGFFMGDAGQHDPKGIGHRQPHRGQDGACFLLGVLIDAGTDNSVGRHVLLLSSMSSIVAQLGLRIKIRFMVMHLLLKRIGSKSR